MASTLESLGVRLTLVKRNGKDGASIPGAAMQPRSCLFGRGDDVDVKILLNTVAAHQCRLVMDDNDDIYLEPLSEDGQTFLNGVAISDRTAIHNGDVVGVHERRFRVMTTAGESCSGENQKGLLNRSLKRRSSVSAAAVDAALAGVSPLPLKSPRRSRSGRTSLSTLSDNQPDENQVLASITKATPTKTAAEKSQPLSAAKYGRRRSSQPLDLSMKSVKGRRSSIAKPLDLSAANVTKELKVSLSHLDDPAGTEDRSQLATPTRSGAITPRARASRFSDVPLTPFQNLEEVDDDKDDGDDAENGEKEVPDDDLDEFLSSSFALRTASTSTPRVGKAPRRSSVVEAVPTTATKSSPAPKRRSSTRKFDASYVQAEISKSFGVALATSDSPAGANSKSPTTPGGKTTSIAGDATQGTPKRKSIR